MEAKRLPAMHGALWVAHGYRLFRAYPGLWFALCPLMWIALFMVMLVPFVGPVAGLVLMPGLTAGLMLAAAEAQRGRPPLPQALFAPLRARPRLQLQLGFAYAAAVFSIILILSWVAPSPEAPRPGRTALPDAMATLQLMLYALPLYVPVMLAFWFAPALVHWRGMSPGKALFFSLVASWRNLRAFVVYGLVWLTLQLLLPLPVARLLRMILPQGQVSELLFALIFVPYGLAVVCVFACSYYSSYVAVFPGGDDARDETAA
ncbi:MAG: hypothetical protein JNM90_19735 [Burkholderiales bacterium]|nr:hypothetical protein [Burkholderiales bacterium]